LLGRLGVDRSLQGQGIGEALVMRVAQLAKREAEVVGGAFLAVDPKTDRLLRWYERQEFSRLSTKTRRMVLLLKRVP
jgi:ribosomal protein S18 acetylase RimI-like enzyme